MEIIFIVIGAVLGFLGYKIFYIRPDYQFEKSTSGRIVKFMDYRTYKKHRRYKFLGKFIIFLGIIFLGAGLLLGLLLFFDVEYKTLFLFLSPDFYILV